MISKTLSPENQFMFTCPVFKANTKINGCFQLRDMVYRGEGPPIRQGCQVAIHASKCPIPKIITKMIRMPGDDPYHSAEPKLGSLRQDILDDISVVLVPNGKIDASEASGAEKAALYKRNEEARAGVHMVTKSKPSAAKMAIAAVAPPIVPETPINNAAATGDLSAAIN